MPLSIFIDALPFNEIEKNYSDWFSDMQLSELIPNIAYSSSLHWQLYLDKYPDERGMLVDWVREKEKRKSVKAVSFLMRPFENMGKISYLSKKVLDRIVFKKNTFANIPYKFRGDFTEKGKYLFWSEKTYKNEPLFKDYSVISQDEGHRSFEETISLLESTVKKGDKNIFAVFSFADAMGHKCRRGEEYSKRLLPYMKEVKKLIDEYRRINPKEEVLIVSDHGMSTVTNRVDFKLEEKFGKQSKKTYIAYSDSAIMCIWCEKEELKEEIKAFLSEKSEGHLLNEEERKYYGATDKKFGDLIYILKEGNVFKKNWFSISFRKPSADGSGMHGFWPDREAEDSMAVIMLIGSNRKLEAKTDYRYANKLINSVMKGEF